MHTRSPARNLYHAKLSNQWSPTDSQTTPALRLFLAFLRKWYNYAVRISLFLNFFTMSYIQDNLLPEEKIKIFAKPTGKYDIIWWIPTGLMIVTFFTIAWVWAGVDAKEWGWAMMWMSLSYLFLAFLFFLPILKRWFTEYAVTNKRVIIKTGIISVDTEELTPWKIETVNIKRGILDRMFNTGKLQLKWSGGTPKLMRSIDNYNEMRTEIYHLSEKK